MNKTLLLILVDFLLLTLLSMTKWDEPPESKEVASPEAELSISSSTVAVMDQGLLDTLQSSLEEEREIKEQTEAEAARKLEELNSAQALIENRETEIKKLEQSLAEKEQSLAEKARAAEELSKTSTVLKKSVEETSAQLEALSLDYEEMSMKAKQSNAQSLALQEELKARLAEIEAKENALAAAREAKEKSELLAKELNMRVKVSEEEKRYLRENVDTLKEEITVVRQEKEVIQQQAGKLADGVTQLAEQSESLQKEFRSSIPINANQLFDAFLSNQVETNFSSVRNIGGRLEEEREEAKTVVVTDGEKSFALVHIDRAQLGLNSRPSGYRGLAGELKSARGSLLVRELRFMDVDPRLAAIELSEEQIEILGVEKYLTAIEPFKFTEAVLVNARGSYYGEVEFKLDARTPGYVKMSSKIVSRMFGEFSPSKGDLVLSKTGELLGVMVDRNYCALVSELLVSDSVPIGASFSRNRLERAVDTLKDRYSDLPRSVR